MFNKENVSSTMTCPLTREIVKVLEFLAKGWLFFFDKRVYISCTFRSTMMVFVFFGGGRGGCFISSKAGSFTKEHCL